jgi:tetratricopeptide (TPR) repeat protein/transcriptional regulator with XRE-family HTH domain
MNGRGQRQPLPDGLRPGERDFFLELRRLVDTAGLTYRELEKRTSTVRTDEAGSAFYSKSQWARWLNGQAMPPRRAVRRLAALLTEDDLTAGQLLALWERAAAAQRSGSDSRHEDRDGHEEREDREEPEDEPVPPRQVPSVTPHFTGRAAELAVLDASAARAAAGGGTEVILIAGTAGVGKTTLANYFCQRVAAQFPDGQLHVNLRGFDPGGQPLDASAALRGFLEALGVKPASVPADPDAQAALYRTLVADRGLLIVLDNARGVEQVRQLIPGSPGCLVVVTSRNELAGLIAQGAQVLTLTPFTGDEALWFLARRLGAARVEREPEAAGDLVRLCARLPLAMSVAAAHAAAHPAFPLAALVDELRSRGLDQLDTGDPETSARTVFSWSYHYLSDPGKRVFRLLGVHPGPDTGIAAAASLAAMPAAAAHTALRELGRAHLTDEHAPGRFAVHDLLRAYAAELAAAADGQDALRAAELRLLDHYLHTGYAAAMLLLPSRECGDLAPPAAGVLLEPPATVDAATAWFTVESRPLLAASARAAERGLAGHGWQLPWVIAPYLISQGHWVDFAATQRAALAAAQRTGDLRSLGHAHYHLGYALDLLGDGRAADEHLRQGLDAFARAGDQLGQGLALHGLAQVLQAQGRYSEALPVAREALRLRTERGNPAAAASSENSLGSICIELGLHAEALEHCQRALRLCEEAGIGGYRGEALYNLGLAHFHAGDPAEAVRRFEQAADIFRVFGDMPYLAATFTALAHAHRIAGNPAAAGRDRASAREILDGMPPSDAEQVRAWIAREAGPSLAEQEPCEA